jgi:gliding motility-associated lipoprotein GldD
MKIGKIKRLLSYLTLSVAIYYLILTGFYQKVVLRFKQFNRGYTQIDKKLPYKFEIPKEAKLILNNKGKYWLNILYPDYGACIYLTYKDIESPSELENYIADSKKLAEAHKIKASYIEEKTIKTKKKGYQIAIVKIRGDAPSTLQFYTLDSTKSFLRGALYFEVPGQNNRAMLQKIIERDIRHMLDTLELG